MRKILFFVTFLFSLLFISCCFNNDESLSLTIESKKKLSIYVSSAQTNLTFNSSQRTISPEKLDSNNLDFYLSGNNKTTSTTLQPIKVDFSPCIEDSSTGVVTFYLPQGTYDLTLTAIPAGETYHSSKALLQGNAYTDLRNDTSIFFYLTSNNIKGNGSFDLAIYTLGWQVTDAMLVTVGIYNLNNDAQYLYRTEQFNLKNYHYNNENDVPSNPVYNYKGPDNALKAGTYIFKTTIEINEKKFYYTDRITIEPNRTTTATIGIPNIVTDAPKSPSYLIAQYQKPETKNITTYPVEFCWDDNSKIESNYQLELIRLDDYLISTYSSEFNKIISTTESIVSKNNAWTDLQRLATYISKDNSIILDNNFYNDEDISKILEGSLSANKTYCTLNLDLGYIYLVRICAVSAAGNSSYVYLDVINSKNKVFTQTISDKPYYQWTSATQAINLYRIAYELNNGRFYDDLTNKDVTYLFELTDYYYQTNAGTPIKNPINFNYNGATSSATLKAYSSFQKDFQNWRINTLYGDVFNLADTYTGSTNLTLYADFGEISENPYKLVGNTNILVFGSTDGIINNDVYNTQITLNSLNFCKINKTTYPYAIFSFRNIYADIEKNTSTAGIYDEVFTSVSFQISEQGSTPFNLNMTPNVNSLSYSGASIYYSFVADLTDSTYFKSGKTYNVIITATVGNQEYHTTIIFDLEE